MISRRSVAFPAQRKGVAGAGATLATIAQRVSVALSALLVYASGGHDGLAAASLHVR
jgi:hypothetical protein